MSKALFSTTAIYAIIESVLINDEVVNVFDAHRIMIMLRDEYEAARVLAEARIAELEAQLAARPGGSRGCTEEG